MTPRTNQRDAFVKAAAALFHQHGFRATGVDQVITAAGGSKGSFYHHFKSKDELGCAVLDAVVDVVVGALEKVLCDPATPPIDRLLRMIDVVVAGQAQGDFRRGCLLGNMAAEVSGSSEPMRAHLDQIFSRWVAAIAKTLRQAEAQADLPPDRDPDALAAFMVASLEGAILVGKVSRNREPLDACRRNLTLLLGRVPADAPEPEPIV